MTSFIALNDMVVRVDTVTSFVVNTFITGENQGDYKKENLILASEVRFFMKDGKERQVVIPLDRTFSKKILKDIPENQQSNDMPMEIRESMIKINRRITEEVSLILSGDIDNIYQTSVVFFDQIIVNVCS